MKTGTPRIDGIVVGEIHVNCMVGPKTAPGMEVKAAFCDTKTGATHGFTNQTVWPAHVYEALEVFKTVLETHLATVHFTHVTDEPSGISHTTSEEQTREPGGLGESFGNNRDANEL